MGECPDPEARAATRAKLSRSSRTEVTHDDDLLIIEEVSHDAASIVEAHRHAIAQWRDNAVRLDTTESTEENHDKVARSLNNGIDALMKAVKGERQAYQLDEEQPADPKQPYAHLSDEGLHVRIRELNHKLGISGQSCFSGSKHSSNGGDSRTN